MYDFNGHAKKSGGDILLARLYNLSLNAGVAGQVVDHRNGSYSAVFSLPWEGSAHVEVIVKSFCCHLCHFSSCTAHTICSFELEKVQISQLKFQCSCWFYYQIYPTIRLINLMLVKVHLYNHINKKMT